MKRPRFHNCYWPFKKHKIIFISVCLFNEFINACFWMWHFKKQVTFSSLSLYLDFSYLLLSVKAWSLRNQGLWNLPFDASHDFWSYFRSWKRSILPPGLTLALTLPCLLWLLQLSVRVGSLFLLTQIFIFILRAWVLCLNVWLCTICVPGACICQKKASGLPELQLQKFWATVKQTNLSPYKSSKFTKPSLQSLFFWF